MELAWTYLITAGLFEIGWPVGLKIAQEPGKLISGVVLLNLAHKLICLVSSDAI